MNLGKVDFGTQKMQGLWKRRERKMKVAGSPGENRIKNEKKPDEESKEKLAKGFADL